VNAGLGAKIDVSIRYSSALGAVMVAEFILDSGRWRISKGPQTSPSAGGPDRQELAAAAAHSMNTGRHRP